MCVHSIYIYDITYSMGKYIYVNTYVLLCIHMHMYTCMYVFIESVCMCIYVYMNGRREYNK